MGHEVEAKLVLDDHATEALHKVREGFEHVEEKVKEVQSELVGMVKQTIAVAAGFQLSASIDSIKELGHEMISAASSAQSQQKSIAGVLAMTDKTGKSFEDLTKDAEEYHEKLEQMGIAAGVATSETLDAFEMIAARSEKPAEAIMELTGQMTLASKALPGGMGALSSAFRDLESGFIRPKNAVVQLIKMTGTAVGSQKQIAKHMTAMFAAGKQEEVFKLAETAMDKMATKMKNAPLTYDQLITSLKDIRETIFKDMGTPLIEALGKPLGQLKKYISDHREEIGKFAHMVGEKAGEWVLQAAEKIKEGFSYIQTHADEIEESIKKGVAIAKGVVEFILAHKEEIAIAFGAKMLAPSIAEGAKTGMALGSAALSGGRLIGAASGGLTVGEGGLAAASVGTAAAAGIAALALADVAIIALLAYQIHGLIKDIKEEKDADKDARIAALQLAAATGDTSAGFQEIRDKLVLTNPELATMANSLLAQAETQRQANSAAEAAAAQQLALIDAQGGRASNEQYAQLARMYQAGGEGVKNLIAHGVQAADGMGDAFAALTYTFDDSGQSLVDRIKSFDKSLGSALQSEVDITKAQAKPFVATNQAPPMQDFRGSTFNIKQDFRDADPDNVALVFRRDLVNAAYNPIQGRGGGVVNGAYGF